ncbi:MAG: TonB-dependent receptor plug domain-containing protein, partial [Bacteroidetes bacterium]|nr:TonB-dependent receptor plug domain-containing protein [Bacteroidota bacterium]
MKNIIYLLLILCAAQQAIAQSADTALTRIDSLSAVTITGVRGAVLLRETPIAIVAVSSKKLIKTIEPNIVDALVAHVPGLNAVKTGPNISKPFIRGLGYNRVLTLYDGIRQEGQQWGDEHGIEVDAYGIERAEVIKGPASLLYGSDALGGVVSLFPYLPTEKDGRLHGRVLQEYQSNNGLIGSGLRINSSNEKWWWAAKGSYRI